MKGMAAKGGSRHEARHILLEMNEADIVAKLQEIMRTYSTSNIAITTSADNVQFENIK